MPAERYPVVWIGRAAVVTLPAEVDVTNADSVREELTSVLSQGPVMLVADMSNTTFCDSAAVSALVRTFRQAAAGGCDMRLVASTQAVRRVLAITGVDRLIPMYPSLAASVGGPHDQPARGRRAPARDDKATANADGDIIEPG